MTVLEWGEEAGEEFELNLNLNLEECGVEGEAGIQLVPLYSRDEQYDNFTLTSTLAHVRQYCFPEEANVVDVDVENCGSS